MPNTTSCIAARTSQVAPVMAKIVFESILKIENKIVGEKYFENRK
jgi:hypothetical protein